MHRIWSFLILLLFSISASSLWAGEYLEMKIDGSIGPASADFMMRGIIKGQKSELILIKLNTPGGLDKSMRQIVKSMLASRVPVVVYVAPNGARAASAGTFLLYASTIAAMSPSTHLGAASPVSLSGGLSGSKKNSEASSMKKKITNDAIAYIRSLAQLRGRNVDFSQKAITDAATMTAKEALSAGVIDLIAEDTHDLLGQIDGKSVTQAGQQIIIHSKNLKKHSIEPDWRTRFLLIITDPTVAYLLLMLGVYGIFFELFNPGFIAPGVIGAIAAIVALYALQLLPINYAGLALIILGISFIIAEAFAPSFGILGIGGTLAFVVGSILLIDTEHRSYQIAWSAIWGVAAANLVVILGVLSLVMRSRWRSPLNGTTPMLNHCGEAMFDFEHEGQIKIQGEIWAARANQPIKAGSTVKVIGVEGLILLVEPR